MDNYYKKITSFLVENCNISTQDSELYEYAIKVVIHDILNIGIIFLFGYLLGFLNECLCLFTTFFMLRKFTGGLHAERYINCLISSTILILLSVFLTKFLSENLHPNFFICVVIAFSIIISIFSPIENSNKKLLYKEKKIYKIITIIILIVLLIFIKLLMYYNLIVLSYSCGTAIILDSMLMLFAKIQQKHKHQV